MGAQAVKFVGIKGEHADQLGKAAVERTLKKHNPEEVTPQSNTDAAGGHQITVATTYQNGSDQIALYLETSAPSEGLKKHYFVNVSAFQCEDTSCEDSSQAAKSSIHSGPARRLPGGGHAPKAVYLGDFNGDGNKDILVVMANGAGLVMYQQK